MSITGETTTSVTNINVILHKYSYRRIHSFHLIQNYNGFIPF